MENISVLPRIYHDITEKQININDFDDRIIMQKLVYLLGEVRMSVGNYNFVWHKYGPYSQSLRNDISCINLDDVFEEEFLEIVNRSINFIKDIFHRNNGVYSDRMWIENIASCVYMKKYLYPSENWENIRNRIKEVKEYLNNDEINLLCCDIADSIINF